jgi:hypothetical protein
VDEYVLTTIKSKIKLPDYILNSKGIISFNADDNLCFWNCLAYSLNLDCRIDRIHRKAVSHSDYKSVDIEELNDIESHFIQYTFTKCFYSSQNYQLT